MPIKTDYTTKQVSVETEMLLRQLIWYLPPYIFNFLIDASQKIKAEDFETKTEYQKAREMRIGAILALCLYHWHKKPHYVAIPDQDPPDLYIAEIDTSTEKKPARIMSVEVTVYLSEGKSLKEQLIDSDKTPKKHHFDENTIILVNVGINISPDYSELRNYLHEIEAPYEVWCLQDVSRNGTTYARFVRIAPEGMGSDEICIVPTLVKLKQQEKMMRIKFRKSGASKAGIVEQVDGIQDHEPWKFTKFDT